MIRPRNKTAESAMRVTLRELPYYSSRGDMCSIHGNFNNSLSSNVKSKKNLDKVASFHDLDIFTLKEDLVPIGPYGVDSNTCIQSRYLHSFHVMKNQFCKCDLDHTLSIFHNNTTGLKKNVDSLQCEILDELDFHFHLLGVTETKIINLNEHCTIPNIPGYNFEHVPTPLSAGGVRLFIDQSLDYLVLEKTSRRSGSKYVL